MRSDSERVSKFGTTVFSEFSRLANEAKAVNLGQGFPDFDGPDEVKQARWLIKERQETLAEATREADRLVAEAREQASRASAQTEIVRLAEREADAMIADARRRANSLLSEVEDWADGLLAVLEVNLDNFLAAIRRGRERLHERSRETVVAGIRPDGTSGSS